MANEFEGANEGADNSSESFGAPQKTFKLKPTKSLPTDRVSFDSQLTILRGFAKASAEVGRAAVSNADAARFATIGASSISNCNPFWNDAGLLIRDGNKQRPIDAIFDFDQAADWDVDKPATKLASVLSSSWFGKALLAKLSIKSASTKEAVTFLAEECKAPSEYRAQVELLLQYLEAASLITIDGSVVTKIAYRSDSKDTQDQFMSKAATPINTHEVLVNPIEPVIGKRFSIPIPDKTDAVITLPEDLDSEDWAMVQTFLSTYVQRWKKFGKQKADQPTEGEA